MNDGLPLIVFSWIIIFAIGYGLASHKMGVFYEESREAIEQCEQDLPRNKNCHIIAVPENSAGDTGE